MEYRGILEALLPAKRTYFGQYILLCLVKLAVILLGLNALFRLLAVLISFPPTFWIAINLAAAALAAAYFWLNRPGKLQFVRWLDEQLNSKERLQTLFELEHPPPRGRPGLVKASRGKKNLASPACRAQAGPEMRALIMEETGRYLAAHPPAVALDRRLFKRWLPALLAALLVCAGVLYISPALSQKVSRGQELRAAQQEAEQLLSDLEELLSDEPLLEELQAELALIKQQLAGSQDPEEVALALQEARELLAAYAEALDEAGEAYHLAEELLSANSAAEIASALQEDPRFNQQLMDSLQGLQDRLFQVSTGAAIKLKPELSRIEEALAGKAEITATQARELQELLSQLDPAAAQDAVQSGLQQLAPGSDPGPGSPAGGTGSETGEGKQGQNQGQGGVGESPGSSGSSGQNGTGAAGEGNGGQQDEGPGETAGNGTGSSEGSQGGTGSGSGEGSQGGTGGSQGQGAGSGSGALSEQQFHFIPGDRQVNLGGTGEAGSYTWQELLKYNPGLVPEDLSPYFDSYYHQGVTAINRGQVPQPLESYLRAYFQAIIPPSQ